MLLLLQENESSGNNVLTFRPSGDDDDGFTVSSDIAGPITRTYYFTTTSTGVGDMITPRRGSGNATTFYYDPDSV